MAPVVLLTLSAALTPAHAGYGDPVDGVPSPLEREVHLWTNAVRVDPAAFGTEYPCAFGGFPAEHQTAKVPLWWNAALGTAARLHSEDMASTGERSHLSSDGTNMIARLSKVYNGNALGENIAEGYDMDARSVVVEGWMCSEGHREQIMSDNYVDLGTGWSDRFWTQDFGGRDAPLSEHKARLGTHFQASAASSQAEYRLAVHTDGAAPDQVVVVVNGTAHNLILELGVPESGIYSGSADDGEDCVAYWFEVDGDSYPEDGAFGFGDCPFTDPEAQWLPRSDIPALQDEAAEDSGCGCNSGPTPGPGRAALVLLGLAALRRRR